MKLTRASLPVVLRRLLIAGVGVGTAVAAVVSAAGPAQGQAGGTVLHWGWLSTVDDQLTPVTMDLPAPVAEVGSSNSAQYALLTNGTVYAWGQGVNGQLGDGGTANSYFLPVQVKFPAGVKIAFIPPDVMPYNSGLAVDTTGHVWAWGANKSGEFCLGNKKQYDTPVELPFTGVSTLAGAGEHATYDADGTVYSCGDNQYGQLGDGSTTFSVTPVRVSGLAGQRVASLVASWSNTGAVLANGQYFDWGYNAAGQVGDGIAGTPSEVPFRVPLPGSVTQAALGGSTPTNGQTLVLLSNGSVYAWGNDAHYQLGDGRTATEDSPERINPPFGVTYRTLATGGQTSYAISTAGNLYAWGYNNNGEIGNGLTKIATTPVEIGIPRAATISSTAANVLVSAG
jgi:alpha-tubulin suppressor-like RCC1 family protein